MKIKEMFKKITAGIGVFLATVTSKVFAAFDLESHIAEPEYGIPTPSPKIPNTPFYVPLLNFLQIITIPIIIILGIIIFVKKRKNQKIQIFKVVLITAIIIFIIASIIKITITLFKPLY